MRFSKKSITWSALPGPGRCSSGHPGVGPWLYTTLPDRRLQRVRDGAADTLRPVGPASAPTGTRPCAAAALDAAAPAALRAGDQDRAQTASGPREPPRG